jgi:ATP-dependent DNA ligase
MNAQGVKNEEHLERLLEDPNYVAQEKLDGMRAVVHVTKDGLRIFSRSAGVDDPTRPLEKTTALPHLAELKLPQLAGTILDCEILLPGEDSATLAGTVHRKNGNGQNTQVKMFVFDCLHYCGKDITNQTLEYRLSVLAILQPKITSPHIVLLPYAYTTEEKWTLYNKVLADGGEGIMLKNLSTSYVQGGRPSNNWYKAKKSATFDCVIMGFTKGAGKYNNRIGAVRFGQYVNGTLVELGQASGMSDIVRYDMSKHPKVYIGKVVTIKGMERLKSGAIRHPQYLELNPYKQPHGCVWYKGEQ